MQANLLQPLTDISTIELRYDALEELLASDYLAVNIAHCLKALPPDLDKTCSGLVRSRPLHASEIGTYLHLWSYINFCAEMACAKCFQLLDPMPGRHVRLAMRGGCVYRTAFERGHGVQVLRPAGPRKDPVQRIGSLVQSTILVREMLTALPTLADALQPATSELLKAVGTLAKSTRFALRKLPQVAVKETLLGILQPERYGIPYSRMSVACFSGQQ